MCLRAKKSGGRDICKYRELFGTHTSFVSCFRNVQKNLRSGDKTWRMIEEGILYIVETRVTQTCPVPGKVSGNSESSNIHGVLRSTFCFQVWTWMCTRECFVDDSIKVSTCLLNESSCSETQTSMTSTIAFFFRSFYIFEVCFSMYAFWMLFGGRKPHEVLVCCFGSNADQA